VLECSSNLEATDRAGVLEAHGRRSRPCQLSAIENYVEKESFIDVC